MLNKGEYLLKLTDEDQIAELKETATVFEVISDPAPQAIRSADDETALACTAILKVVT